jgi:hypothetical protein
MSENLKGKEILDAVRRVLKVSRKEFERATGMHPSSYQDIMTGKYGVTDNNAFKITRAYPQISFDFLKTGTGSVTTSVEERINIDNLTPFSEDINAALMLRINHLEKLIILQSQQQTKIISLLQEVLKNTTTK